ncbi:MAG: HAMP domain-containing histidine kinase [Planctomycetaceae bacterium]|nr:HAMP domain-containing histidine kinase [Planctomycetaceae bacterium]
MSDPNQSDAANESGSLNVPEITLESWPLFRSLSQPAAVWLSPQKVVLNEALARLCGLQTADGPVEATVVLSDADFVRVRDLLTQDSSPADRRDVIVMKLKTSDGGQIDSEVTLHRTREDAHSAMLLFRPHTLFPSPCSLNDATVHSWLHLFHRAVFGDLAASLFHRLTQPATTMRGATEIIQESMRRGEARVSAEIQRPLELLMEAGMTTSGLVRSLRHFVCLGRPDLERVEFRSLLESAILLVRQHYQQNRIVLKFGPVAPNLFVICDAHLLTFVIVSILEACASDLAVSYTDLRAASIAADSTDSGTEIVIIHSMSYALLDRILSSSACLPIASNSPGATLFALCRTLVEAMGGKFSCSRTSPSVPELQFRLLLPGG